MARCRALPQSLRGVCSRHDWARVKPAVRHLLVSALRGEEAPGSARAVDGEWYTDALDGFTHEPPFTLQRLCELLLDPGKHYSAAPKLAHALDKLLCVTSTVPSGADALQAAARTHPLMPVMALQEESMAQAAEGPAESVGASLAAPSAHLEGEPHNSQGQP